MHIGVAGELQRGKQLIYPQRSGKVLFANAEEGIGISEAS